MRKLLLILTLIPLIAKANTDESGYSFFMGIGKQHLNYQEKPSILPVETSVDVNNPLLISGALYALNDSILFSLDAITTFAADMTTEEWKATSSDFGGTTLTNSVVQENDFSLQLTETRLLVHYRVDSQWFAITGPSFRSQTFKRFGFRAGPDNATNIPDNQVVEESTSEILWHLGAALESEHIRDQKTHYSARLYASVPLWREVQNTLVNDHIFDETGGYDVVAEARYSYAVHPRMHVGLWGQYLYSERDAQRTCIAFAGANSSKCGVNQAQAELPESELQGLSYGLEVLWKL